jgi:chemotaxis protein methyltransferase CheR
MVHDCVDAVTRDPAELNRLLVAIRKRYRFDFRGYARKSLTRRISQVLEQEGFRCLAELRERLVRDVACMERFLLALSVTTTSMYRDPGFWRAVQVKVLPQLRTFRFVRIWLAGCSTGEEVYSMAILLNAAGLTGRCRIFGTDMNEAAIAQAREGIYPLCRMQEYTRNYLKAGGVHDFSRYYRASYGHALLDPALRENVVFARHNLVTDQAFGEFQVILCRNVMIYFNQALQDRVHNVLYRSLDRCGFLGLGKHETIQFTPSEGRLTEIDAKNRLYQKMDESSPTAKPR